MNAVNVQAIQLQTTDLHRYRAQATSSAQPLMDVIAAAQGVHVREAGALLAQRFGLAFWDSLQLQAQEPLFKAWPVPRALQTHALLMTGRDFFGDNHYFAVSSDPFDSDLAIQLEQAAGQALIHVLASPEDIHAYLNQQEATLRAVDSLGAGTLTSVDGGSKAELLSLSSVAQASSPAVKLVSSTLYDALRAGASDVHLESTPSGLAVKYRIDGVLDEITQVSGKSLAEQVISRLKVLAELDIAERRVPQDGSFQVQVKTTNSAASSSQESERLIDLRVSIMPSVHGEDAVIRILDKQAMLEAHGKLSLDALGFDAHSLKTLRGLMQAAYGMLLVTGPTGSGKTTTLYAALAETQTGRDKIITIEDPVEYQLPGVLQIPVNEKKGLTFARGLRSILRHDPDKIMVGEIRDRDTAEIAVQSALTGHLVLTTVHANNVFDVFGRFTHMGLDPYALVSALNGIWAQRLIRITCQTCAVPIMPSAEEVARFGIAEPEYQRYKFMQGAGCGDCRGTGYKGRRAIAEVLQLDDELREMIVQRLPMRQIKEVAHKKGASSLLASALDLVRDGLTSLEEVRRVTLTQ